ncbi:MAG: TonB-dependent receptor [Bacteroidia bacterium]
MKTLLLIKNSVVLMFLLASTSFLAQSTISGTVKDQKGELIPGANISLKGTSMGTTTNFDGKFEIKNVPNGTFTLVASYLGYDNFTKQVVINSGNISIDVILKENAESLDEIIVTGVTNPKSKIESSVSITTIKPSTIASSAPRTTAEIFRTIPGIRSESSGGEGNSNIAVRGVPVSSGGSKYVQLQEDGLPVLLFGDIAFATADIFTRFDSNISRIEAIRGGSASTLSSNSPGAIINFISKTGKTESGSLGTTFGLDYGSFRTDFDYGAPIAEDLYFHVGGFYRAGEGLREAGFTANNGGQLKFNLTKEFDNGYIRLYGKLLNDRAAAYLPMPIAVSGTNSNPTWSNAPNFSATRGTSHTPYLTQNVSLGGDNQLRRSNVADGMNPNSKSIGLDISFDLADDWKVRNNGRFSVNNGNFVSPFPAQVASAADIAASFGVGSTLQYATNGASVPNTSLVSRIHMFDVELNNFNNFMNDFKLSKSFDNVDITVGYFKSIQNISMSWLWNSYLQEVSDSNARLINVFDSANNPLSENGLYAYGVPFWGNCCQRNYDTQYDVSAPYANVSIEASEKLNVDIGLRYDRGNVTGSFAGAIQSVRDMNNDGVISEPEKSVSGIDNANRTAVNYDFNYLSYSIGANYKLNDKQAVFARVSKGGAAKADRILFSGLNYTNSDQINALDFITQAELGYKKGFDRGSLYATLFFANTTEEGGFEATSNTIIENDYRSAGLELEGTYRFSDNFGLRGGITYTNAKITSGGNDGNKPRRQPDFIYNLIPTYTFGSEANNSIGLSFIGQSKAFAQDNNDLVMPGFVIVNSFVNVGITSNLSANLAANNIFDTLGITESEEGSIVENQMNIVRARPVPGRSISLGLRYSF